MPLSESTCVPRVDLLAFVSQKNNSHSTRTAAKLKLNHDCILKKAERPISTSDI